MPGFQGYAGPPGEKGDKGMAGKLGSAGEKGERVELSHNFIPYLTIGFYSRETQGCLVSEARQEQEYEF